MSVQIRPKSHVVVFDIGACTCRAGFAGEDQPRVSISSVLGTARHVDPLLGGTGCEFVVGNTVHNLCDPSTIRCPFKNGFIQGKDDYEKIFRHLFEVELHTDSERRSVVISEPIHNPKENRNDLAQVLFEVYRVPSIYLGTAPALSLYTSCKTTGVALDIGDSFAQVSSVYEWTQLPQTLLRTELGGRSVSRFFQKSLKDMSYHFSNPHGTEIAQTIKELHGYVALDFHETVKEQANNSIECEIAPDTKIRIGEQRYRCPELLFNPKLDSLSCFNVAELVYESIMRADIGLRPELWSNIVIAGGTALLTGFEDRLKKELTILAPDAEMKLVLTTDKINSAWIGGSILGSLALFGQMVVTKEEYRESGPVAIRRRFY